MRLSHIVEEIAYTETDVMLRIANGEEARFDAVIITLPLGVLKSGKVRFTPALPEDKQTAINRLGMGTLDKVYLLFDTPFWDDQTWITILENRLPQGQFNEWLNLHRYLGEPVIMAFNGGSAALELSGLNDEEIVQRALQTLNIAYPV